MTYPIQVARTYVNPSINISASGLYRSYLTQYLANDFPAWMHLRQNPRSVGQSFIAATAIHCESIDQDLEYNVRSKFLNTSPIDEIDVLYRTKLPSNISFLNASASGVRCIAAPSGCSPSGVSQIWIQDVSSLEDFYYNAAPTRLEISSSGDFVSSIDGIVWNTKPSGVLDKEQKKYDVWKNRHDLSWCYADGGFRKQDVETMEDYEVYPLNAGYGVPTDMCFKDGALWWIGKTNSNYYLNLTSTKTQEPVAATLDMIASFNLTDALNGFEPLGIIIDQQNIVHVCDTNKMRILTVNPRYDYFILDKVKRYIYFREDYRDSGVFISNT